MTGDKWMIVAGGVFLLVGLLMAFIAVRFGNRVAGAGLAVGVIDRADNRQWLAKERRRRWADKCFSLGLLFTAIGVVLQTWGSVL